MTEDLGLELPGLGVSMSDIQGAWLDELRRIAPADLLSAIEALAAVPPPSDKRFLKAIEKDLEVARSDAWESFLDKGMGAAVLDGTEIYYKKPIPAEILDVYRPLVQHAKAALLARIAD